MSAELDVADYFYFRMLERELVSAKHPEAVPDLRKLLRFRSIEETKVDGPIDPLTGKPEPRTKLTIALTHRLTDYDIRLDGESGEPISWYLDFLAEGGDESMLPDEAIALATKVADPPEDTQLASSGYETMAGRTLFRVRWSHTSQGLPVEDDFLEVLVNAKARLPFSHTRRYRTPDIAPGGPRP